MPKFISRRTSTTKPVYVYNYLTWEDARYLANNLYNREDNNMKSRKSVDLTNKTIPNKLKNIFDIGGNAWEYTINAEMRPSR